METPIPTVVEAERLNLTSKEFEQIKDILNRTPNALELEIFSRLWSEHACYKSSLKWLKTLPVKGESVLLEAGSESAGAIDLGNGKACVMKIESFNHPCAIQPKLGANTGLRIVVRDVASKGSKPVALLNSIRMGDGTRDTARWLFDEISQGMCEFERGYQVPILGGETLFSKDYNSSPVVNNFAVGLVDKAKLLSGIAEGQGNLIVVLGALTGNDGMDDSIFTNDGYTDIGTKPVPMETLLDVSVERHLQEALEAMNAKDLLVGAENITSHGIIGAACEMAARAKSGIRLELDSIPVRDKGMEPRELLLSQTWARMMLCVRPECLESLKLLAASFQIHVGVIGTVVDGDMVECRLGDRSIAVIPAEYVGMGGKAPVYDVDFVSPENKEARNIKMEQFEEPDHYPDVVKRMLVNLNVASKSWLTDKFDQSINGGGDNYKFPSDAAFVDIEGTNQALALSVDCNSTYMKTDAFKGAQIAVAEACRNIVCGGGVPLGISDCLNFGNPKDKEIYGTFVEAIKGIARACNDFSVPVLSGNVSFFNQRSEEGRLKPITPTPVIGIVGLVEDRKRHCTLSFRHKGDMIFLVGQSRNDVNSSEFAVSILDIDESLPPYYDAEEEKDLQNAVKGMVKNGFVRSIHDVSNGGLFFTLLESSIPLEFGFDITTDAEIRKDAFLFGESQSRVVVSVAPAKQDDFVDFMMETDVPFSILGHVTKGEIRIDDESFGFIADYKKAFEKRLASWVDGK